MDYEDMYNMIKVKAQVDANNFKRVLFGGGAITRIEGKYNLL